LSTDQSYRELAFPRGFLWGVGTSAYQMEGGSFNTQWYEFEKADGIRTGEASGKSCNWWYNAEKDFDIAQSMGLNSLRLSVSWARIEPEQGVFNPAAIERYRQMLAALIERGIRPIVCLHHFAHPIWFEKKGAFLSRDCVTDFSRFVKFTVSELSDYCNNWLTFNEPNIYGIEGYVDGNHPPALHDHLVQYFKVLGNMGLCHGSAYHIIHNLQQQASVSFANHFLIFTAAKTQFFDGLAVRAARDSFNNIFINMVTGKQAPLFSGIDKRLDEIKNTWDYVGMNIYGGVDVAFDITKPKTAFVRRIAPPSGRTGDLPPGGIPMFGEIYPQGIKIVVERLAKYGKPFFILENGVPDKDDKLRPWVIATAVKTMHDLIRQGHNILGYHHWSLVDNFEWALGYAMKFGLVAVDPATQERKPRPSASFYAQIAKANALTAEMVMKYVPAALDEIFPSKS